MEEHIVYQLVIQFPGDSVEIYDDMIAIENALIETLTDAEVDGHDIGSGEANIFIYTEDPAATFAAARPELESASSLDQVKVAYRPVDGEEYVVIWPPNYEGRFEVL